MNNEFREWIDKKTTGFRRGQKAAFRREVAAQLGITSVVLDNWYLGKTPIYPITKIGVNAKIGEKVFEIED